ncbi:MAG: hypothetical protein H6812_10230 [Phycisphaeraceae bacterium]|nr:hypothetical protein [Phycisphaerales bacterium]MCA9307858.1 hypothetical protein [Phycisphaerales bacterium]MCB9843623.1 hypothetical protein [Phycisphaeraceae bacterium]
MNPKFAIATLAALVATTATLAQYDITRSTIDGGGNILTGATYTLSGAIGQADAGILIGGTFALAGGFWSPSTPASPHCPGDITNADGMVDVDDLNAILSVFGTNVGIGDPRDTANNDGFVDVDDLNVVLANFGATCP